MSIYYYIGCEACKECTPALSDAMSGFNFMGGNTLQQVPRFVEKHVRLGHTADLRFIREGDDEGRDEDYTRFEDDED